MSSFGGFEPPSGPPAGWYPDPYDPSGQRYWDGRQWDLTTPIGSAPVTDEYPDIGNWLDRSFRSAYRRWRAVAVIAVATATISTLTVYLAIERVTDGLVIDGDEVEGWTNDRIPGVVVLGVIAALVSIIGALALTWLMLRTVDGDDPSSLSFRDELGAAGQAFVAGFKVFPRTVGWFLALTIGMAIAALLVALIAVATGPLAVIVAFLIVPAAIWLFIRWAFVFLAIIDQPGNPFPRSTRVVRGRWWGTFGRLLLIGIVTWLIGAVVQTAISLISGGGFGGVGGTEITFDPDGGVERYVFDEELDLGTSVIVFAVIGSIATTILTSSVVSAAMAIMYRTRNPRH